jgi:Protein of unknown function (DUF4199)
MRLLNIPLLTISLKHGLTAGLLSVLLLVATYYMGQHPLMISPYFDYRIILFSVFIFFALKEYRDSRNQGVLYFWQGMMGSYLVIAVAGTIGALGLLLFAYLEKDFVPAYIRTMTQYLEAFPQEEIKAIGKEVYDRNLALLPFTTSKLLAISYFGHGILIGLFISIVLSVILRKQPKT